MDKAVALLHRNENGLGYLLLAPVLIFLLLALALPVAAMLILSFWTQNYFDLDTTFTLRNFAVIFDAAGNPLYLRLLGRSILMAALATCLVIATAYPMAYFLAFHVGRGKLVWIILITIPFWTSYLLRIFAWKVILGFNGLINSSLIKIGVIAEPIEILLYNPVAVTITLAHAWAAYAILPIYVSLAKIDRSLLDASEDLGDSSFRRFMRIILPLSAPGTVAAGLLVFIPTVGDYVTATLVGGPSGMMVGNIIQSLFGKENNAPLGAALSVVTMASMTILVCAVLASHHLLRAGTRRAQS